MVARIRRFVRGQKGMEALQAVILLGAAFVVTWGLMEVWDGVKDDIMEAIRATATGQP